MKNKKTYYLILQDLIDFGFIIMAEKSINQHTANIICLPKKRISTISGTHLSTISGTVPIVKRIKHLKQSVNGELKTGLIRIFKTVRNDIPDHILETEAGKFINKYGEKDLRKDINLINTWAVKIIYEPEQNKQQEFDQTAERNRKRYGL